MIELDFTNADTMTEDKLVFYKTVNETDNIKLDSSTIMMQDIKTTGSINANYSLIVFGNIEASDIKVSNDLICFGNLKCDSLNVTGNLKCFKNVVVKEINIASDAFICSGVISGGIIDGNLLVGQNIEVVEVLSVSKNVFCNEGAVGNGHIKCNNIICNEYMEIDVETIGSSLILEDTQKQDILTDSKTDGQKIYNMGNLLNEDFNAKLKDNKNLKDNKLRSLLDRVNSSCKALEDLICVSDNILDHDEIYALIEIMEDKELINLLQDTKDTINSLFESFENLISRSDDILDYEEICFLILKLSRFNPVFKEHYQLFKQILDYSETHPEREVMSFLKFIELRKNTPEYIQKISICQDFFEVFIECQKKYIDDMQVDSIKDQSQFANCLYLLEKNRNQFTDEEYLKLIEKLYGVIGIKPTMVQRFIRIGG